MDEMTEAVRKGNQKSTLRQHLGSAIAFVGLPAAMVVGMATTAQIGWIAAVVVMVLACVVHYT